MVNEKSVSQTQQRLMGQAYAVRQFLDSDGKKGLNPEDLKEEYKETILKMASDMSKEQLKDFASTSHKDLPEEKEEKKEKAEVKEGVNEKKKFEMKPQHTTIPEIHPYLKPEDNKPKKKNKYFRMQNLVDYREFTSRKKSNK